MQYQEQLSNYIRKLRGKNKISLNSFALKAGIEPSTLSRTETGILEIKISILTKIANIYNLTPSQFLKNFEKTIN